MLSKEYTFGTWISAVKKYAIIMAKDKYEDGHFPLLEKEKVSNEAERRVYASLPFVKDGIFFGINLYYLDKDVGDYWDIFRAVLEAFKDEEIISLD